MLKNKKTHRKTISSYRAVVDYDVDSMGMEAWCNTLSLPLLMAQYA
jgi:hypothetical protein